MASLDESCILDALNAADDATGSFVAPSREVPALAGAPPDAIGYVLGASETRILFSPLASRPLTRWQGCHRHVSNCRAASKSFH